MAGLCVVPKNDHDDATLLPSAPEVAGFEIENTQNTQRNKFMISCDGVVSPATAAFVALTKGNRI